MKVLQVGEDTCAYVVTERARNFPEWADTEFIAFSKALLVPIFLKKTTSEDTIYFGDLECKTGHGHSLIAVQDGDPYTCGALFKRGCPKEQTFIFARKDLHHVQTITGLQVALIGPIGKQSCAFVVERESGMVVLIDSENQQWESETFARIHHATKITSMDGTRSGVIFAGVDADGHECLYTFEQGVQKEGCCRKFLGGEDVLGRHFDIRSLETLSSDVIAAKITDKKDRVAACVNPLSSGTTDAKASHPDIRIDITFADAIARIVDVVTMIDHDHGILSRYDAGVSLEGITIDGSVVMGPIVGRTTDGKPIRFLAMLLTGYNQIARTGLFDGTSLRILESVYFPDTRMWWNDAAQRICFNGHDGLLSVEYGDLLRENPVMEQVGPKDVWVDRMVQVTDRRSIAIGPKGRGAHIIEFTDDQRLKFLPKACVWEVNDRHVLSVDKSRVIGGVIFAGKANEGSRWNIYDGIGTRLNETSGRILGIWLDTNQDVRWLIQDSEKRLVEGHARLVHMC